MQEILSTPQQHTSVDTAQHERTSNHDPLAHVWLIERAGYTEQVRQRIYDELLTDLAERSPDNHFYGTFTFQLKENDLISPGGVSLVEMYQKGLEAARCDGHAYGIQRARSLHRQLPYIIEWATSSQRQEQLVFFSLCPDDSELSIQEQKVLNFKSERKMSSNWLFEKLPDGTVRMHAFSFDGHTLARHAALLERLGLPSSQSTTLDEVASPYLLNQTDGDAAVEAIRALFDTKNTYFGITGETRMAANERVLRSPEVFTYYEQAIIEVAHALRQSRVTRGLRKVTKELAAQFQGYSAPVAVLNKRLFQVFSIDEADSFIEYLRSYALPHYIYADQRAVSIAESGAVAMAKGIPYDGACPSSSKIEVGSIEQEMRRLEFFVFRRRPIREKVFTSQYCPCCLPKPEKHTTVMAWIGEGFIGCDDCGHIMDVCTQEVYEQGRPSKRLTSKKSFGKK